MKTKEVLADSFRELVLTTPFQKISIKLITDKAGVIRPTFYNYFQDKYEVIEYLFEKDISSKVKVMLDNDMDAEAIRLMFLCFEKNRDYYRGLFEVTGQNSFEEYFGKYIEKTFMNILKRHPLRQLPSDLISPENMARFNSLVLLEIIRLWLSKPDPAPADKMFETYILVLQTPVLDMMDR